MAATLGFDVAAGVYESTLNAVLAQVYDALYPYLLKGNIVVGEVGIASADFDIQAPPTVSLAPSEVTKAHVAAAIETVHNAQQAKATAKVATTYMTDAHKSALLDIASLATFTASVPKLAVTINYSNGSQSTKIPSASLVVHATVSVDSSDSDLTVKLLGATVTVPGDPVLTQLLDKALVPYLLDYLNTKVLGPIKIPKLAYKSVELSTPLPVVQQSYLTAFSALGSTPATIPAPLPWPKDGIYIAVDIPTVEAAAGTVFPLGPQENFSWNIFSGHVGATLNTPTISSINADGSVNAAIEANASCQLKMDTPWPLPDISFGPSATARLACTLRPLVEDGELKVVPEGIPIPSFSFSWGIPGWIDWLFSPLEAGLAEALNAILGPVIAKALDIPGIPILKIPVISIKSGGDKTIKIALDKATPRGLDSLLVVSGQLQITVSSQ